MEVSAFQIAEATPPPRRRVLVVDDHADTTKILCILLERRGYEARGAQDGETAVALALAEPFDLLICDIGLPTISGWDVLKTIQKKHPMKAIVFSGYGMAADVERSLNAGFLAHLTKPLDLKSLIVAIEQAIGPGIGAHG